MPGRRKKNFKKNLRNNVIERYTLGSAEIDPSFPMPSGEEDDEATMDAAALQRDKRLEEQQKYGIGFNDDYDYLQHLKDVADMSMSEMKELVVLDPKSETECEVTRIAAANIADASKPEMDPDWDPEVMAALDEDFDFDDPDNELEDDFMDLANPSEHVRPVKCEEKLAENFHDAVNIGFKNNDVLHAEEDEENDNEDNSDADSTAMELGDDDDDWTDEDDDEEDNRKASCSEFSSSAVPRNKKLQLLDAQTKAVLQREYTEDQIGALDFEELNGRVTFDSDLFKQTVKEIHDAKSIVTLKDIVDSPDRVRPVIPESWKYVEERGENDDGDYDDEDEERRKRHERAMSPKKPQWDCMSILSTLSNTKNIPKTVVWPSPESEKRKKTSSESMEVSNDRLNSTRGLTLKELEQQMKIERLADAPSTYRPSGETPEEKKERKQAVKEHKQERRAEKKANKLAFRTEMQRQTKVVHVREAQEKIVSLHVPN